MSKVSSLVVVLTLLCATSMLVYGKETVGVTSSTLKEIPTSTLMERKDTDSEYRVSGGDYGRSLKNDTRRKSAGQDDERSVSP